ncbi:squalene synthase 2 isoform X2 [Spinacia oleracea]|uniref:Squalene synthase 2 isoform X2 n=1 Tax=Spinacia oleracea TaxID=3562 RepID=A0ABM3QIK4_SPIOL|nr:squalene synthase 2-like isoform X2 [Spinacia oleracea]
MGILKHPDEIIPLLKLMIAVKNAEKQIPTEAHWGFCYSMIRKVSRSFAIVMQPLATQLRNAACVFYLILRALDTVEDDTSIATDIKLPILRAFHQHIYEYDRQWHFSWDCKVLMDEFHHVSTAFLELDRGCQVVIEDMIKRTGEAMAQFIGKEVVTVNDYDAYCQYVVGPIGLGMSKLFHNPGMEDLAPEDLSNSVALLLQKTNIIHDYLEDINEIPEARKFWPREIWCKYVNQLEDLKCDENSEKAVECLNEMVTNSLSHVEDCLTYLSALRDHAIFRASAIPLIMSIGTLALCYNNKQFFRGPVKMRRGLAAVVFDQTNTMPDVYGAFYDFASMMKSNVDKKDPNAMKTLRKIEAIQSICRDSGTLNKRKLHIVRIKSVYSSIMIMVLFIVLAVIFARLYANLNDN